MSPDVEVCLAHLSADRVEECLAHLSADRVA